MSFRQTFDRPRFIPLVMTLGAVGLMLALGTWQLQRLSWKEALIARIETANRAEPLTKLPKGAEAIREKQFYRLRLEGEYLPEAEFHLAARYFHSQLGYAVLTPFALEDGRTVLVNRGWIPTRSKEDSSAFAAPQGQQAIEGIIRTSDERNPFTPENQPEKNIWFGRDVAQIADHSKLDLEPLTLDLIGEQNPKQLPVPSDGAIALRNDHLNYAITWFALGLGFAVISLLYHRKKKR